MKSIRTALALLLLQWATVQSRAGTAKDFSSNTDLTSGTNYSPSGAPDTTVDVRVTTLPSTLTITTGTLTMESLSVVNGSSYTVRNATGGSTNSTLRLGNSGGFTNAFSSVLNDVVYLAGNSNLTIQGPNNTGGAGVLNVNLASSGNFNIGAGSTLTVSSVVSGSTSTVGLIKTGEGTLVLSGANTYTGTSAVSGGTLQNGSGSTFNSKGRLSLSSTGVFDLGGFGASVTDISASSTTSTIINNGNGPAVLTLSNQQNGNSPINSLVKDGIGTVAVQVANHVAFSPIFQLTKQNTFSGGLTLLDGSTLSSPLNEGTRLRINGAISTTGAAGSIISGPFGTGAITIGLTATDKAGILFDTVNNNTLVNDVVFNTGLGNDNPGIRLDTSGHILSGTVTVNLSNAVFSGIGSASLTGQVTGPSGVELNSGSVVTVMLNNATANANNYAGNTLVGLNSTLSLGAANQIPNGVGKGLTQVNGTLKLGGFSETINGLVGAGTLDGVSGTPNLGLGDNNATGNTFSGTIKNTNGNLSVTKIGTGTQTLTGFNTYSGATVVVSGTLEVGTGGTLSNTSLVTVNTGGTLLLDGTVGNKINDGAEVTLDGGTLKLDTTTGSDEQVGALTLNASSIIDFGTLASGQTLRFADSSAKSWMGTLSVWNYTSTVDHLYFGNVLGGGVPANGLSQINFYSDSGMSSFRPAGFGPDAGEVSPVPEPSSVAIGVGLLGLAGWRERKRISLLWSGVVA